MAIFEKLHGLLDVTDSIACIGTQADIGANMSVVSFKLARFWHMNFSGANARQADFANARHIIASGHAFCILDLPGGRGRSRCRSVFMDLSFKSP
jgi:hypothetical protein